jgi:signal transduction histidine kinase
MRERARRIGGRLDVTSAPGRGTRVALRVPVAQKAAA